jgi:hypothetical protein
MKKTMARFIWIMLVLNGTIKKSSDEYALTIDKEI